ncbi:MAG: Rpn family recombination-promoting nuclease/putative transposase [Oscillibacter sp.]|nr:Rpn family recombination-promoting nuclease/putative transposase [Oscillibacter sp.]
MAKPIEELTIIDDFMFGAVMSDAEYCKPLLELILGVKIRKIGYPELQKTLNERYGSKSVRLDVYVEDDAGTVYDVEIQTADKKNLPKRARYYQGLIDLGILEKGGDYAALRKSFVIFICAYDPFGRGRWVYAFENLCRDNTSISLGDGAAKVILNTKGYVGEISGELKALLRYMGGAAPETNYTRALDGAVMSIRRDEKWRRDYMLLAERDRMNQRLGRRADRVSHVRKFRGRFDADELAELYTLQPKAVTAILDAIDAHPDWDDETVAENVDFE